MSIRRGAPVRVIRYFIRCRWLSACVRRFASDDGRDERVVIRFVLGHQRHLGCIVAGRVSIRRGAPVRVIRYFIRCRWLSACVRRFASDDRRDERVVSRFVLGHQRHLDRHRGGPCVDSQRCTRTRDSIFYTVSLAFGMRAQVRVGRWPR